MDILVEIDFPSGTEYYCKSSSSIEDGGNQYLNKIISISNVSSNIGSAKDYQISDITVEIEDTEKHFSDLVNLTRNGVNIFGVEVRLSSISERIKTGYINSWKFNEDVFSINIEFRNILDQQAANSISTTDWPYAVNDSIGQPVPRAYNTVRIKAWKVHNVVNYGKWLLGMAPISSVTRVEIAGEEISSSYWSLGSGDSPGGTSGWYWLNMGHGVIMLKGDYCYVDVTTAAYEPVEIITDVVEQRGLIVADTVDSASFNNYEFSIWLNSQGYDNTTVNYLLDGSETVSQVITDFCNSFECDFILKPDMEVIFMYTNRNNFSDAPKGVELITLVENEIFNISTVNDYYPLDSYSTYKYDFDYNPQSGGFDQTGFYYTENSNTIGAIDTTISLPFITDSTQALLTVTEKHELSKNGSNLYSLNIPLEIGIDLYVGQYVFVEHSFLPSTNKMFMRVMRIELNFNESTCTMEVKDMDYLNETNYLKHDDGFLLNDTGGKFKFKRSE